MSIQPTTLDPSLASSSRSSSPQFLMNRKGVGLIALAVVMTLLGYLYADSLRFLGEAWLDDNNSHGPIILLIVLGMIGMRWQQIHSTEHDGSWWGILFIGVGLFVYIVGEFAGMYAIVHVSLWIVIIGLITCAIGLSGIRQLTFPLCYLLTAIPLPVFLQTELSSRLQLWSSALGIEFLRSVGITALREGNVIDLGRIQLQVVEACSGLRYLFPLTALTLLAAYLYRESLWKRIVLVLSSIPISILLNGFRIGAIGVLVEYYGSAAAEGFSHMFEGWFFFVVCLVLLAVEMWALARIGSAGLRRPFADLMGLPDAAMSRPSKTVQPCAANVSITPIFAGGGLLALAIIATPSAALQEFPVPVRQSLVDFPLQLGTWQGVQVPMEQQYLNALQMDDFVLADYEDVGRHPINVYVAYYQSPIKGRSSHSPRQCIPGGGWDITSFELVKLNQASGVGSDHEVNRVVIQKGNHKQIVYYWFKQRDRWITSEYLVKFFLFWDSLTRHRADGALVRLVSGVYAGENEATVDDRLKAMAGLVRPLLSNYVPD